MAIRTVVTRGYGIPNTAFLGTIPSVVLRGYMTGEMVSAMVDLRPRLIGRSTMDLSMVGVKRGTGR